MMMMMKSIKKDETARPLISLPTSAATTRQPGQPGQQQQQLDDKNPDDNKIV